MNTLIAPKYPHSQADSTFEFDESLLLSIIIVSYNTKDLTLAACNSALTELASSKKLCDQSELIVVDNNSKDGSVVALQSLQEKHSVSPSLHLITNSTNAGFAAANNRGITNSRGKYLFLLNSDTEVHSKALDRLVNSMDSQTGDELHTLGILAASLQNPDGTPQPQGGSLPTLLSVAAQYLFLDDLPIIGNLIPSTQHTGRNTRHANSPQSHGLGEHITKGWVGGTAMLVRRSVFAQIGLLDPNIFMYGEDVEFCQRAANHHILSAIDPEAHVTHLQNASGSSEKAILGEIAGYKYIWAKHKPAWQRPILNAILHLGTLARATIFDTIKKDHKRAATYRKAANTI